MALHAYRILVVEDDADCREALVDYLELVGFDAASARDGLEALEVLRSRPPPDAVLLDLKMPRLDGAGLLAVLATDARLRHVPVIVMSGEVDRSCPAGAMAMVQKPFEPSQLLSVVEGALSAARCVAVAR